MRRMQRMCGCGKAALAGSRCVACARNPKVATSAHALAVPAAAGETPRFRFDFSRVRLHPAEQAHASATPAGAVLHGAPWLQAKLALGGVDDPLEREAEATADSVMRMAEPRSDSAGSMAETRVRLTRSPSGRATGGSREDAPPIVHDAIAQEGRPLDPKDRAFFEPRFGQDFRHVRLHTERLAQESAEAVGALAYTVGRNVVWGPSQPPPGSQAGRRLMAHELAHVVQQGASSRWAENGRAQGSVVRRDPKPDAGQPNPAAQPATPPLFYDRDAHSLQPLPVGYKLKDIQANLNASIAAGEIKSATAVGVTPGSTEEIFVLYVAWAWGKKKRWGTEADIVTAIGWPPKPGDPAPVGRITLRIDDQGAATAELLAAGPVPASAQATVAAGSKQLIADYGFKSVKDDGTATWSDPEISDVSAALAMLPTADKAALKGVELIRMATIPGGFSGEFSTGGGVAKGATTVTALPSLKLADLAFPKEQLQFFGDKTKTVPASFQTILHEVGHAVEKENYRTAHEAYEAAIIDRNKKLIPQNESAAAHKRASADYDALYKKYQAAKAAGDTAAQATLTKQLNELNAKLSALLSKNKAQSAEVDKATAAQTAAKVKLDATQVPATVVAPFKTDAAAKKTAADAALTSGRAQIKGLPEPDATSSAAYMKAVEDTAKAIASFVKAAPDNAIGPLEETVLAQIAARNKERDALTAATPAHPALAAISPVATTQDAWFEAERTLARITKRTLRLQKFVDIVTTNKISPFTDYARKNWPLKPEEFYAEAYSLWLTDPQFLSTNYKAVFDFFQNGDYRT